MKKMNLLLFLMLLSFFNSFAWSEQEEIIPNPVLAEEKTEEVIPNLIVNIEKLNVLNQRAYELMPFDHQMFSAENEYDASVKLADMIGNQLKDSSFQREFSNLASDVESFFATGNVLNDKPEDVSTSLFKSKALQIHPLILIFSRAAIVRSFESLSAELVQYTGNTKLVAGLIGMVTWGFGGKLYGDYMSSEHTKQVFWLKAAHNCAKAKVTNTKIEGCNRPEMTKMVMVYQTIFSANSFLSQIRSLQAESTSKTFAAVILKISGDSRASIEFVGREFLGDLWRKLIHSGDFNAIHAINNMIDEAKQLADTIPNSGREIRKGVGRSHSTGFSRN